MILSKIPYEFQKQREELVSFEVRAWVVDCLFDVELVLRLLISQVQDHELTVFLWKRH